FETIRQHLGSDTDGVLLLAASSAASAEPIVHLVQEIYMQKMPPIIMIVEGEESDCKLALEGLDPYVSRRLAWPAEASALVALVPGRRGRGRNFLGTDEESLEDRISRRLLCQTPSLLPMVERIALAASHDVTVLLTGETGTGKTYLARLLHEC